MKKAPAVVVLLLFVHASKAQFADNGFWYFKMPLANVFGQGFDRPNGKDDPALANTAFAVDSSWIESVSSALTWSDKLGRNTNTDILLGTYNKQKGVNVGIYLKNLRIDRLKRDYWGQIPAGDGGYYAVEALAADTVHISGTVTDTTIISSAFVQKIIGLFVGGSTVAGMVLTAATSFDSTKNGSGAILSWKRGKGDSIDIVLNNSKVYFAAQFIHTNETLGVNWTHTYLKCPYRSDSSTDKRIYTLRTTGDSVNLFNYWNGATGFKGLCKCETTGGHFEGIYVAFVYKPGAKVASVKIYDVPNDGHFAQKRLVWTERQSMSDNSALHFEDTYPYSVSLPQRRSFPLFGDEQYQALAIFVDYNLDFDPVTRTLTVWNYSNGAFQTDVYTPVTTDQIVRFPSK
jgi:hypothetical protein